MVRYIPVPPYFFHSAAGITGSTAWEFWVMQASTEIESQQEAANLQYKSNKAS